jgi:hypothetical protein
MNQTKVKINQKMIAELTKSFIQKNHKNGRYRKIDNWVELTVIEFVFYPS